MRKPTQVVTVGTAVGATDGAVVGTSDGVFVGAPDGAFVGTGVDCERGIAP